MGDREWLQRWMEIYYEAVLEKRGDLDNENADIVAQISQALNVEDLYD